MFDGIIHTIVHWVVSSFGNKLNKQSLAGNQEPVTQIRLPALYLWMGIIDVVLFAALAILSITFEDGTQGLYTLSVFSLFALLGLSIILLSANWRIELNEVTFTYRTIFGRQYEFLYSDVIRVEKTESIILACTERKILRIDPHAIGVERLLQRLPSPEVFTRSETTYSIRLPKFYIWIGVIDAAAFGSITILSNVYPNESVSLLTTLAFSLFALLGIFIILMSANWKIDMDEFFFTYRTIWRRTHELRYSDVIRVNRTENIIRFHTKWKRFYIDPHAVGIEHFMQRISNPVGNSGISSTGSEL